MLVNKATVGTAVGTKIIKAEMNFVLRKKPFTMKKGYYVLCEIFSQ